MFTGVYKMSRSALVPTPSAASAASFALRAALAAPWLLDEETPAIMTEACTRPSPPLGAAVQPLVESGSVVHEKIRISLGYVSGKALMKRRCSPTRRDTRGGTSAPTACRAEK